jgi:hypothetical protein
MFKFKYVDDRKLFSFLHPIVVMIAADAVNYAKENFRHELVITQTVSTLQIDTQLGRISDAHRTGRAVDFSIQGLYSDQIRKLVNYLDEKYSEYHYISNSGVSRVAYFHYGTAPHIHLAIHKKYSLKALSARKD